MVKNKNFSNVDINSLPNDFEFENCNFSRFQPDLSGAQARGVRLWPGDDRPRIFRNCNLQNCEPPPGSTLDSCFTPIMETNVPDSIVEELVINGVVEHTTKFVKHVQHAVYRESGYDRNGFPKDVPIGRVND